MLGKMVERRIKKNSLGLELKSGWFSRTEEGRGDRADIEGDAVSFSSLIMTQDRWKDILNLAVSPDQRHQ